MAHLATTGQFVWCVFESEPDWKHTSSAPRLSQRHRETHVVPKAGTAGVRALVALQTASALSNPRGVTTRCTLNWLMSTPVSRLLSIGHAQPVDGHGATVGQFVCILFCSAPVCEAPSAHSSHCPRHEALTLSDQVHAPPGYAHW
jgi:hypothetical protein